MVIDARTDHAALTAAAAGLAQAYPAITKSTLGKSVLGREIIMLSAGSSDAEKSVLYVGAYHATEYITSAVLLRFAADLGEAAEKGQRICGVDVKRLLERRRIYVVPMANPDGVELHLHGIPAGCALAGRLTAMSGGDFSHWQANARGVDLNHNHDARFDEYKAIEAERKIEPGPTLWSGVAPESEPETQAICALLRYDASVRTVLSLHTQGEVIYYGAASPASGNKSVETALLGSRSLGRTLSRMTGYALAGTDGTAAYGGLVDWYVREMRRPGFTLECGRGENPLPAEQALAIYARLREALFCTPYLV